MKRPGRTAPSNHPAPLERGLSLLETISDGRWRRVGLDLADSFSTFSPSDISPADDLPKSPVEQAWLLAETFGMRPDARRGHHGTPRAVATTLAELALKRGSSRVIDPACGGGSLLLGAVDRLLAANGRVEFDELVGWDVDPLSVALSQAVIWVAAGQPSATVGQFSTRNFVTDGLGHQPRSTVVLANPPWGIKVASDALEQWRQRVGMEISDLLEGELNIYTLFLVEVVVRSSLAAGFITPIHWLHRRSLAQMRRALASTRRLRDVFVLRKRVFPRAPDMIPVLTAWSGQRSDAPIRILRTGLKAFIPLPFPLPEESSVELDVDAWLELPYATLPLLRSDWFGPTSRRLMAGWQRISDPEVPRSKRLFHIGDGAYKTRVRDHLVRSDNTSRQDHLHRGRPILTQAAQAGRYRLDDPSHRLTPEGEARLTAGERARFDRPKLVMHALKKASSPWRLSVAISCDDHSPKGSEDGALALTNNFMLAVRERYRGDLHYPLTLLNSRLFNRLYTEHFPGVNIEAFTVGVLPLPWPVVDDGDSPLPLPDVDDLERWRSWAARARSAVNCTSEIPRTVYEWLVAQGRRLSLRDEQFVKLDMRVEAVVAGLMGLSARELATLLEHETL